jgi:predicted Fe-Mo cluster-binding NifX family protein
MKIAIPIVDKNKPEYKVNDKFGRSRYFYLCEVETNDVSILENDNIESSHGAGIQTSSMLARNGVNTVIAKEVGPKALDTLKQSNINVYEYKEVNNIKKLIEMYKNKELKKLS